MSTATHRRSIRSRAGFSFLELLAVLAVAVILAALIMPAIQGMIGSSNLQGSATLILAQLDLARQTAQTRNLPVDLRLYQDTTKPKDANGNFPYRFIAMAIPASASGAAADEFLNSPMILPGDVIIDSNVQFSTLLNTQLGAANLRPSAATELASAPLAVRGMPYVHVMFQASGTMNLDTTQKWCFTLVNGNLARSTSGPTPAANFATLILDPQTSRARAYQP